jgi:tripartite-type tricarboxylate transporter receptor subunit TctC
MNFQRAASAVACAMLTAGGIALAIMSTALAQSSVEQFYKGKQVDFFIGSEASGGYNAYARIIGPHFARHIPGHPTFVYRNMPGASGIVLAGHFYNRAPKDGSAIAILHNTIVIEALLGRKVQYEADKFQWLGSANALTSTCVVGPRSAAKTMEEARQKEMLIGSTGSTSSSTYIVAAFMNTLTGTKFKIIRGYPSTQSVQLAMERGEVDGLCGVGWDSLLASSADRLRDGTLKVLVQVNVEPIDDLKGVPHVMDLAIDAQAREVLEFLVSRQYIGRPFALPPGTPEPIVTALRHAFDETMTDPAFLADAKKTQLEVTPVNGEKVQVHVAKMLATPERIKELANEATQLKGGVIQAKLNWITAKGAEITEVKGKGRGISFRQDGKTVSADLEGTKVTIAGAEAKGADLKPGLKCDIVYLGNNDVAQSVACP